jgi:hypothetical protein
LQGGRVLSCPLVDHRIAWGLAHGGP